MKDQINSIRNVALIGHGGTGKTSLGEAILFNCKVTTRLGKVDQGNSVLDFEPEEIKRNITISAALHHGNWKKREITILDTPGDTNFFSETRSCLQGVDSAILVLDATDVIKPISEKAWDFAGELELPRIIFINKMDRERADFFRLMEEIKESLEIKPLPVFLPLGQEENFVGIIDLLSGKAFSYEQDESGKFKEVEVPGDWTDRFEEARQELIESLAEADDQLLEKYLEGEDLTSEELWNALETGVKNMTFYPLFCGSAGKNMGISHLLDYMVRILPSPIDRGAVKGKDPNTGEEIERKPDENEPFSALVFKTITDPYAGRLNVFRIFSGQIRSDATVYNVTKENKEKFNQLFILEGKTQKNIEEAVAGQIVAVAKLKDTMTGDTLCDEKAPIIYEPVTPLPTIISYAIEPKNRGDEEKVFSSIMRLLDEDPTLKLDRDPQTKEIIISGMGQIHIETMIEKLKRKFGVEVNLKTPKIPYKETIKKPVKGVIYRHKKQTGGRGQFAEVHFDITPLEEGKGFEFEEALVGMNVPRSFVPAVEKGVQEAMQTGVLAGYPVVDVKVRFYDGKSHEVDSSEIAFKIAASMCFKKGMEQAKPTLLEPIMSLTVTVPEEYMGDVIGDLNSRRGKVLGMETKGKNQIIKAQVPMAEILSYAPDLTSMTGGRGSFTAEFDHYEEVPAQLQEKIIAASKAEKES